MTQSGAIEVVIFCGGRGSATIIRALLRRPEIQLTLLVNAYDDGLSTGALRSFIPGMLGPSDFRKNFSYLLGNYSNAQYALKHLMEYRLPVSGCEADIESLSRFTRASDTAALAEPLKGWFAQLPPATATRLRACLARFFDHAAASQTVFDYRDCSLGNLVFAGAYLARGNDFNAAAGDVGDLVGSRARLLNVSDTQNRVLCGLKQDGEFLAGEAQIVGPQSAVPITDLFLLERQLRPDETTALMTRDAADRRHYLASRDAVPALSDAAAQALAGADVILYGPGTQHSSLLPSYRIAAAALAAATAPIKALVLNLESDNDIQGLSASEIAGQALHYGANISHILISKNGRLPMGALGGGTWRDAAIVRDSFANSFQPGVHNGSAVVDHVLALHARAETPAPSVEIFVDIHNRSAANDELVEEFLEMNWTEGPARLVLNRVAADAVAGAPVTTVHLAGLFPEIPYFTRWLKEGHSDYLVLMTGDGAYGFHDVQNIIRLLERQTRLGGVFGSRTQSRRQFMSSIAAAYSEHRLLYGLGKVAAIVLSLLFYLRTGIIFSDPLTGLRVFRRRSLHHLRGTPIKDHAAPLAIVRMLIGQGVEVAELPVLYRTFSGFTDPFWRVRRGLRNLISLLSR